MRRNGDPLRAFGDKDCAKCAARFTPTSKANLLCADCAEYARSIEGKSAYNAEWQRRHPGYSSESNTKWRARNPERYKAYYTQYRQDNLDVIRERMARWSAANPGYARHWLENNRERSRVSVQRRRAKRLAAESCLITPKDRSRALERSRGCCYYCDKKIVGGYVAWDHVVPLAAGGRNSIGNLVPCCRTCNARKTSFLLSEWRYMHLLTTAPSRRYYEYELV